MKPKLRLLKSLFFCIKLMTLSSFYKLYVHIRTYNSIVGTSYNESQFKKKGKTRYYGFVDALLNLFTRFTLEIIAMLTCFSVIASFKCQFYEL